MSAATLSPWRPLRPVAVTLGVCVLAACALFATEGAAAIGVWRSSTAYGHCFLVLPIALWLIWERRSSFAVCPISPTAWPVLLAIPLAAFWLASDWLGIMEGRQLAALGFVELILLAILGGRLWWALSPGLFYLVFLVPFGAFVTPALQRFTTGFILAGLDFLRIPYAADSFQIQIPEGVFYVAEACAGLRFLIASIAFGVLYAVTLFRSPGRRVAFIAVSCVLPVIANGIRGLGIVVLGHVIGSAQAAATDHIVYGWVFFSAVILALALAGLPFREDLAPAATPVPMQPVRTATGAKAWRLALPVLLVAASGPASALLLSHAGAPQSAHLPALTPPQGCHAGARQEAGPSASQSFTCEQSTISVTSTTLPPRTNPAGILDAARGPASATLGPDNDTGVLHLPDGTLRDWVLLTDRESGRVAAYVLWIDGAPALGGLHDRVRMALDMVRGTADPPLALTVAAPSEEELRRFLAAQADMAAAIRTTLATEAPGR